MRKALNNQMTRSVLVNRAKLIALGLWGGVQLDANFRPKEVLAGSSPARPTFDRTGRLPWLPPEVLEPLARRRTSR